MGIANSSLFPQRVFNGITLKSVVMKDSLPPEKVDNILKMVIFKEDKSGIHPFITTGLWHDKLHWLAIG